MFTNLFMFTSMYIHLSWIFNMYVWAIVLKHSLILCFYTGFLEKSDSYGHAYISIVPAIFDMVKNSINRLLKKSDAILFSEPEKMKSMSQLAVLTRRWSPATMKLGPFQEVILESSSVEELKEKVCLCSWIFTKIFYINWCNAFIHKNM